MPSDNETVAEIVNKVHSGDYGCSKCGDLCDCPNADKIIVSIADRIESAHRREVAELQDDVLRLKDIIADERAQHASGEARRNAEVAELKRRLKVAEDALEAAWMYASKLPHQWPLPERVRAKMKNALAAIRAEGGVK